ncbi:MAG: hypothetical protein P4M11_08160 [Candidatus Pacebacteria bacterium]|nr:hypothetical protein [Candidatus Paceibacterota bacterium]
MDPVSFQKALPNECRAVLRDVVFGQNPVRKATIEWLFPQFCEELCGDSNDDVSPERIAEFQKTHPEFGYKSTKCEYCKVTKEDVVINVPCRCKLGWECLSA